MDYLLTTAYLPNLDYLSVVLSGKKIWLEAAENFQKQSFRNRAYILSPNGLLALTVPVVHEQRLLPIKEVRISQDHPWQRLHWRSLESCYRSSPYFEYFEDAITKLYERPYTFLLDYNLAWLEALCLMTGSLLPDIQLTERYELVADNQIDLRQLIHPKIRPLPSILTYNQVFSPRGSFEPGLSSLDLICNEGRNSLNCLTTLFHERNQFLKIQVTSL